MLDKLRAQLASFIAPQKNSMTIGTEFLKYGNNGRQMAGDWSEVLIDDRQLYSGYFYAAIRNRAAATASLAINNVSTQAKNADLIHPYLQLVKQSLFFSEFEFWANTSTYLDLEGMMYLFAVRNVEGDRIGKVQYFKLLNPYNLAKIINEDGEVGGYEERAPNGDTRTIPPEMIIEIRELNPFDKQKPFAMTDAAKEHQFTLKTSGDYTRNALKNNINAPGILSTGIVLETEKFKNFQERVRNHTKGEPIFGNGSGVVDWKSMEQDLTKAALKDVTEISREGLFAISGVSKTLMGIEQSGVTRETSKAQQDIFTGNQLIPRIQLIIDALNLDYKRRYNADYKATEAVLIIDNPLAKDQEAELKRTEVDQKRFDLYESLLKAGYPVDRAEKYVRGEIDVDELGKPDRPEPVIPVIDPSTTETNTNSAKKKEDVEPEQKVPTLYDRHDHQLPHSLEEVMQHQQQLLKNACINAEENLVVNVISKVSRTMENAFEKESDLISKSKKNETIDELTLVLMGFYGTIFMMMGPEIMEKHAAKFDMTATFKLNKKARDYIKKISNKVAESHVETVTHSLLEMVRQQALAGKSVQEIVSDIRKEYTHEISKSRAETISRTETNRAFTQAQYQADDQFIKQNDLQGRVFKKWTTRSSDPCAFCQALEDEGEVPFYTNFRSLGDEVVVGEGEDRKVLEIGFESLQAGNAHPNCACSYELVIRN